MMWCRRRAASVSVLGTDECVSGYENVLTMTLHTPSFSAVVLAASVAFVSLLAAPFAAPLAAQERGEPAAPVVPAHLMPPTGKCRIWMEGVAPAQQPAPTDCQTALRQKPANGTVIFGPTVRQDAARAFRPSARPASGRAAVRDSVKRDSTPQRATPARVPTPTKSAPRRDSTRRDTTRLPARRPALPDPSERPS